MNFEVVPAIDLRGGRCVRLFQGDYRQETVYDADPAAVARRWQELGARRIHVVDLDGARTGEPVNVTAVEAILRAVDVPLELGGGVRDLPTIERWLAAGVERVYLGTAAVTDPELLSSACRLYPGRIAAGADARDGRIAVRGWEEKSSESVLDFARRAVRDGVVALSYTNIVRDGTFSGPDIEGVRGLIAALGQVDAAVYLAGGVGSLADIETAAQV